MAEEKKGMGCFAKGCIVLVVIGLILAGIAGIGTYLAYNWAKGFIATSPIQIPVKQVAPEQYASIRNRFEAFGLAVQNNLEARLELTADDINSVIAMEEKMKDLRGKCQVRVEKSQVSAQVSLPLDKLDPKHPNPQFAGKYLNGSIALAISIQNGELMITPRSVEVNGKQLPDTILKTFSGPDYERSFKEGFHKNLDPQVAQALAKIKSFKVENDKIIIQSAVVPGAPTGSPVLPSASNGDVTPGKDQKATINALPAPTGSTPPAQPESGSPPGNTNSTDQTNPPEATTTNAPPAP